MDGYEKLQEELKRRIHKLGFEYLGLITRFQYPDLEKIECLTCDDINCIGSIVEDIFRIRELERKLQQNSQESIKLTFQRATPLTIARESFLQYGSSKNPLRVHLIHSFPRKVDDKNNYAQFDSLKPFYPFLQFQSRSSKHPLLNKLYFSLSSLDYQYPFESDPVEFLGSKNIELSIEDAIKRRKQFPTRKIGTF